MKDSVHIVIKDRERQVFEGDVKSISSVNKKGPFDVLPVHANFITIIRQKLTLHKLDGTNQEMYLDNGVMKVRENQIEVYLGVKK